MDYLSPYLAKKRRRLNPIEEESDSFSNEEQSATGFFGHLASLVSKASSFLFHRGAVMSESCPSSSFASPERPRRKAKAGNAISEVTDDCAVLKRTSRIAVGARKQAPNLANGTQHIITLNDSEVLTDAEDSEVTVVTPSPLQTVPASQVRSSTLRISPSSSTKRTQVDDDIQIIERNGFGNSRNDWSARFSPPVEPNRRFQKEDTPFEDSSRPNEVSGVPIGTESAVDGDDTVKRFYEEQLEQEVATSSGSMSRSSSVEVIAERISSKVAASGVIFEEETSSCSSSPLSPLPEHSDSRTVSPLYLRLGSTSRVDKWSRRHHFFPWSARQRLKTHSSSPSWESPINRFRKQLGIGALNGSAFQNVINMEEKERFRRLNTLFETQAHFVPSSHSAYTSSMGRSSDTESVLRRGKAALSSLFGPSDKSKSNHVTVHNESRQTSPTSERNGDEPEVQILEGEMNESLSHSRVSSTYRGAQPIPKLQLCSHEAVLPRKLSGSSSDFSERRTPSVVIIWDKRRDESFKERLESDRSKSELRKQRELSYEQKVQQRNRLAEEISLERQLREESRHDEETSLEEELIKKLTLTGHVFRNRVRKVIKDEFPELSNEADVLIEHVWDRKLPLDERISAELTRKDLMTLRGLDWLNDEVINFYMDLICERARNDPSLPKVYAFTTFFYPSLLGKGYQSVRRWTRKVDIFEFDILLLPIHLGAHWCLAVIDFPNKRIDYYDSMGGENRQCLSALANYLGEEMVDKKQTRFDLTGWKLVTRDDIPQQMNGSDCGMFTCKFAEFAARRAHISFTQEHMPYFRRRMVYEICRRKLM
uniref:Ubiquitin-like protease family profile domain-containing protein n=2 Tax=Ascarididae TaxID=6250 RepID=A0A915BA98_PARUN